ncbi:hypothetical protein D9756_001709 [Leucocoprinus leucothites]|uniref:Uncharacterized protein n=1 Tax=Leucocoprinus leucothites TaxID=201217 RepID=A0A8H5G4B0_9AGAR|nr:hypothetical protein D9756_001709 [Leucoagaricus leucothites]
MANLPPKPESPVKDERRHDARDGVTTARPMALVPPPPSTPIYRSERPPNSYVPRSRPESETYIPAYAPRRPVRPWESDRHRDHDWRRERRSDWRDPDRRDTRPFDRRRDDDRFRRRYDSSYRRSRSPLSRRSRSPPRHRRSRSPPPRRFSPSRRSRSRSRSPHYRRGYSPPRGRPRASSRSRSPLPRSPPPKRLKLGNHSISDSPRTPRTRSRSHVRSRSRTRSRTPRRPSDHNNTSNTTPPPSIKETENLTSRPTSPKRPDIAPSPQPTTSTHNHDAVTAVPKAEELPAIKTEEPAPTIPSPRDHPMHPTYDQPVKPEIREGRVKMEITKDERLPTHPRAEATAPRPSPSPKPEVKAEPRGRSHSPPKGPRAFQWRKTSKSPPKGPRNQGSSTPSMVATPVPPPAPAPASMPVYPTGPRADRRLKEQTDPSDPLQSSKYTQIPPLAPERWLRVREFQHPDTSLIKMEAEIRHKRASRMALNRELDNLRDHSRRALHEVEMANIDLRAAEGRRKVVDVQLERAKQGTLGIDYVPPETTSD